MTELKCDYDGAIPRDFNQRLEMVARYQRLRVVYVSVELSGSGKGYHVCVGVSGRVSFLRVVLVQALLGSDWKRELFNSRRALAWRHVPEFWRNRANVLYKRHHKGVTL